MSVARGSSRESCDDLKVIRNSSVFLSEKKPRSLSGKRGFFHGLAGKERELNFGIFSAINLGTQRDLVCALDLSVKDQQ